jgi:hydroxyacylglutathione hydrolase
VASSTVGYERLTNWGLAISDEDEFVRSVLAGQPEPPRYFAEMKRINKEGPRVLGGFRVPPHFAPQALPGLLARRELVVDARPAAKFAAGYVPGTINIPLDAGFTTWAGSLLPYDRDIYLLLDGRAPRLAEAAVRDLATIGLDRVAGTFAEDAVHAWEASGGQLATIAQVAPADVATLLDRDAVTVIDVRGHAEWDAGHLPTATNLPLGYLPDRSGELARDKPIILYCHGGARSAIAASVLRAHGVGHVLNMAGGYTAWKRGGFPTSRNGRSSATSRASVTEASGGDLMPAA